MGLEPFQGVTAFNVDDFPGAFGQCFSEPNTYQPQNQGFSWMFIFICSCVFLALACLLGWIYKRADDAFRSFEGLYTDVAVIESSLHTTGLKLDQIEQELTCLRSAHQKLQDVLEMTYDTVENM